MTAFKRILVATLSAAVLLAGVPVEARPGGGSVSTSRASPSVAPARAATGGMQRSNAMAQARAQSPQAAPAPYVAPAAPARTLSNQAAAVVQPNTPQGYSGKQVLGAAAVAGAAGYMLGHSNTPTAPAPVIVQNGNPGYNGGYAPQGNAYQGNAGSNDYSNAPMQPQVAMVPMQQQSSSGSGFSMFLLVLLVLGGVGFFMYRRFGAQSGSSFGSSSASSNYSAPRASSTVASAPSQSTAASPLESELLSRATTIFCDVQVANNRGDKQALASLIDEAFLAELTHEIDTRAQATATKVITLSVVNDRVLDFAHEQQCYVGSVHFIGTISEGNAPAETIEEVWHFVRNIDGGNWKVAGIEQV